MDAKDFALLVSEDIKNKVDQQSKEFLRLRENREDWRECLLVIIDTVTSKIDGLRADATRLHAVYGDFVNDPAPGITAQLEKTERFRFHAEKRLAEVDRLLHMETDSGPAVSLTTFLREAIISHRQLKEAASLGDHIDEALWDAADGKWGF